jgi:hypothetical protein
MPSDARKVNLWTVVGTWAGLAFFGGGLQENSSTFVSKVEETPELWPEESARAGTAVVCHDHVEPMQWGSSPFPVGLTFRIRCLRRPMAP